MKTKSVPYVIDYKEDFIFFKIPRFNIVFSQYIFQLFFIRKRPQNIEQIIVEFLDSLLK